MKLRCWPGCLAEIINSNSSNDGNRVIVIERAPEWDHEAIGPAWRVKPLTMLRAGVVDGIGANRVLVGYRRTMNRGIVADKYLRPVYPVDDATEVVVRVLEVEP